MIKRKTLNCKNCGEANHHLKGDLSLDNKKSIWICEICGDEYRYVVPKKKDINNISLKKYSALECRWCNEKLNFMGKIFYCPSCKKMVLIRPKEDRQ